MPCNSTTIMSCTFLLISLEMIEAEVQQRVDSYWHSAIFARVLELFSMPCVSEDRKEVFEAINEIN